MRRFWCFAAIYVALLGLQLGVKTDHRIVAMAAFIGLIGVWLSIFRHVTRHKTRSYWIGSAAWTRRLSAPAILMAAAIAVAVAIPPATSKDVNSYALYGRMVSKYHSSPYTHEPVDFAADAWFKRTSYFWTDSPSVYGPVFTSVSASIMSVAGESFTKARLAFQAFAALSLIASVVVLSRRIGRDRAIALVGLNPLLITFGINDAHCDLLIGWLILCGALFLEARRFIGAGIFLALAASVKIAAIPALAGAFIWAACRADKRAGNALRVGIAGAVTFCGALLAAGGLDALEPLHGATSRHTRFSIWNPVHQTVSHFANADVFVSMGANLTVLVVACFLIYRHRRDTSSIVAITVALVTYQLLGAYVLAWYAAWSIPALALVPTSRTMVVAMAHGCWVAIAYFSGYGVIVVSVVAMAWVFTKYTNRASVEAS